MRLKMKYCNDSIEVGKVKPCPFCGTVDKLEITERKSYNELVKKNGYSLIYIECKTCAMEFKLYEVPDNNYDLGVGILITRWNQRKEDKA